MGMGKRPWLLPTGHGCHPAGAVPVPGSPAVIPGEIRAAPEEPRPDCRPLYAANEPPPREQARETENWADLKFGVKVQEGGEGKSSVL